MHLLIWFFIGYWILNGAGFLSWPLFFVLQDEALFNAIDV